MKLLSNANWSLNKALSPTSKALKTHGKALLDYHHKQIEYVKSHSTTIYGKLNKWKGNKTIETTLKTYEKGKNHH
jgi:hypothetical protein